MKNNTKVRLHLSKQLFESLTKEIIKEAKANDGYTVAVKQPKQPKQSKQSKSQATSPEVQKTDAETKMESAPVQTASTLAKDFRQKAQQIVSLPGISSKEVMGLQKLIDTILSKASKGELGVAIDKAQRVIDMSTKNIQSGDQATPTSTTPTSVQTMNAAGPKDKPAIPGLKEKMSSKEKMSKGLYNEMEMNVAEEGQLDEFMGDPSISWESIAAGMAAIGLAPLAIDKLHKWWEKKHPESFKKDQGISRAMDRQAGNEPGQGHGVDQSNTFGPKENTLKEYEQHYRMVNGQCRRYNDEGEYDVVASHYCY